MRMVDLTQDQPAADVGFVYSLFGLVMMTRQRCYFLPFALSHIGIHQRPGGISIWDLLRYQIQGVVVGCGVQLVFNSHNWR